MNRRRSLPLLLSVASVLAASPPALAADDGAPVTAQVVGGTPVPLGRYPYVVHVVSVFDDGGAGTCTGSVVAPQWVLTAGHCVRDAGGAGAVANGQVSNTRVRVNGVGASDGTTIAVDNVVVHPGWRPEAEVGDGFDVALLHLASASGVTPVRILTQAEWDRASEGVVATVVGFGDTNPTATVGSPSANVPLTLREAALTIVAPTLARTIVADSATSSGCFGDSGGPLLVDDGTGNKRVAGVVHGGVTCNPPENDGTYFADVAANSDWIAMAVGSDIGVDVGSGPGTSGRYNPVTPQRLLDTRGAGGMGAGSSAITRLVLSGAPADATAVAVNLTTVNTTDDGYLTAFACDRPQVDVYTLTFPAQQATPNLAVLPVGGDKALCVWSSEEGDLIVDLAGWYRSGAGSGFTSLAPTRVLDTRFGPDPRGVPQDLVANTEVKLTLRGANGVAGDATAVLLNITGVTPAADGYITAYPCDQARPTVSNLNPARNQIVANQAAVTLAADGSVCLYSYATTDLVVDLNGYFSGTGAAFTPLGGVRVADTAGANADVSFYVGEGDTYELDLGTFRGFTTGLRAVTIDLTAFSYDSGYITAYACDQARPTASNLNYAPELAVTNLVTVPVAANGKVCLYSYKDAYVTADLMGWYL